MSQTAAILALACRSSPRTLCQLWHSGRRCWRLVCYTALAQEALQCNALDRWSSLAHLQGEG